MDEKKEATFLESRLAQYKHDRDLAKEQARVWSERAMQLNGAVIALEDLQKSMDVKTSEEKKDVPKLEQA